MNTSPVETRRPQHLRAFCWREFLYCGFPYWALILVSLTLFGCASRPQPQPVSREAIHNTKVWVIERHPQIEHTYVQKLFARLLARLDASNYVGPHHTVRVYTVFSQDPAMFSLCDGSIFISSKTLIQAQSAAELAALLAHELAHIKNRHACFMYDKAEQQLAMERQADKEAVRILARSLIDPRVLISAVRTTHPSIYRLKEENIALSKQHFEARLDTLNEQIHSMPKITTKLPEERLLRKVQSLLTQYPRPANP